MSIPLYLVGSSASGIPAGHVRLCCRLMQQLIRAAAPPCCLYQGDSSDDHAEPGRSRSKKEKPATESFRRLLAYWIEVGTVPYPGARSRVRAREASGRSASAVRLEAYPVSERTDRAWDGQYSDRRPLPLPYRQGYIACEILVWRPDHGIF
jgi:hypothetical protein